MNGQAAPPLGSSESKLWDPVRFAAGCEHGRGLYAVCILNQPLERIDHLLNLCDNGK